MITVCFNCSSPYVGYSLKKADYEGRAMLPCKSSDLPEPGYTVFNSSGSFMLLANFNGLNYFHTRQSQSEKYDEQGRRIYANVAFAAGNPSENAVVSAIAAYVFFEEEAFYTEIAAMITLTDDGFVVDYDVLAAFLKRFAHRCTLRSDNPRAQKFFDGIMNGCNQETIRFIVRESTWNYFAKQAKTDFNNKVWGNLSYEEAQELAKDGKLEFHADTATKESVSPPLALNIPSEKIEVKLQELKDETEPNDDGGSEEMESADLLEILKLKILKLEMLKTVWAELAPKVKEWIKNHQFLAGLVIGVIGTCVAALIAGAF